MEYVSSSYAYSWRGGCEITRVPRGSVRDREATVLFAMGSVGVYILYVLTNQRTGKRVKANFTDSEVDDGVNIVGRVLSSC